MYKVKDLAKLTGLKEPFVRRCLRELKNIFEPHIERGAKNSLVLASSIIPIFDKIKQDKANGLSLPAIKNLLNSDVIVSKQIKKDLDKKLSNTTKDHGNGDEWLSVRDAAKLSKMSETTIRRLVLKLRDDDLSVVKKESGKRGKWLITKKFILEYFGDHQSDHHNHYLNHQFDHHDHHPNHQSDHHKQSKKQVLELLEKQIEVLQEQLQNQTDDLKNQIAELKEQLKYQATDFKELLSKKDEHLNQKDQQIHQLHVLLQESKTSTIDYKPDDKVGVFSKVLMRFGL